LTAVDVDVRVFERLIAEETPDTLKQATDLYRGDFLAGLDVKEESFEEWLLAERERLWELAQQALAKLLAHQIRAGAAKQAIQTAVQLLVLDPLQEAVHRTLMRLYAAEGRRAAALRQYQTCVAVLKRELGVEPEVETKQLYQQILREQAAQVMITGAPAEAPMYGQRTGGLEVSPKHAKQSQPKARRLVQKAQSPLLVGREVELGKLQGWLEKALQGKRQIVFVTGEAGIGKTTVVDAFMERAAAEGGLWIGRGQCLEHYGAGEAYLPVLEALGRLCRGPGGERLIALLEQHAPTWLVQMPALLNPVDLEALQRKVQGATRERMLREMAEAMEALTAERPLVLVLEDLHWSDHATLDLISMLAQRREPARLLVIGTYRPEEVAASGHPLKTVKQALQLHGQCEELRLELLTEAAVAQYLTARFAGNQAPTKLARMVHRRTDGNPLFMVNMVDHMVRQGWVVEVDGRWEMKRGLRGGGRRSAGEPAAADRAAA
jgi:predicted ATPase